MKHLATLSIVTAALIGTAHAQCPDWSADLASANPDGYVYASTTFDDGAGRALYVGGSFAHIGGIASSGVARWNGSQWTSVGSGLSGTVLCFCVFDSGSGPKLYTGGTSSISGSGQHGLVRRLDGATWTTIANFNPDDDDRGGVYSLVAFDDGSGPHLYAGGNFEGTVVRWDVPGWSIVAGGFENDGLADEPYVRALCVHDDGQGGGPALYVGGSLRFLSDWTTVGPNIARLSNGAWTSIGALGTLYSQSVASLFVHDDGSGPSLYAGGSFAGGIRRWTGSSFVGMGTGLSGSPAFVTALGSIMDGNGPKLVAAGRFSTAGGQPASNIAAWNGAGWNAIGAGISGIPSTPWFGTYVYTLATFDQGTGRGPDLIVGGAYTTAGGIASPKLAELASCGGSASGFCFGDGSSAACPCGNASAAGAQAGCLHSFGVGGTLRVHGRAQISDDTLVLTGASMPDSMALYYQGASLLNGGAGATFGDGIHCAGGPFVRMATKANIGGASQYPGEFDSTVSVRGHVTTAGTRYYQARYRNAAPFCTSDTFNYTSGIAVAWSP